jgi:hypothetical protein
MLYIVPTTSKYARVALGILCSGSQAYLYSPIVVAASSMSEHSGIIAKAQVAYCMRYGCRVIVIFQGFYCVRYWYLSGRLPKLMMVTLVCNYNGLDLTSDQPCEYYNII